MIGGFRRTPRKIPDCSRVLLGDFRPFFVDPVFELTTVGHVKAVEQRSSIKCGRILQTPFAHRQPEMLDVAFYDCWIQTQYAALDDEWIVAECAACGVDELIEGV